MEPNKPRSALAFVLLGLVPYSRPNMLLAFRPNQFFNELEKISSYKRRTLEEAARRARAQGLIEQTKQQQLRLTELGKRRALPYVAQRLADDGQLMVVFDIPEEQSTARRQLRMLLKKWGFVQVQKSVWLTQYDYKESLQLAIDELGLENYVRLYECSLLFP